VQAADAQMKALGFAAGLAWVPHPIQNRTPDELAAIADATLDRIVELITAR
jgi:hypothetical protein